MTIAFWCVLVGALLPFAATVTAKAGGRMPVGVNAGPRPWLDTLSGMPARAHWAQLNSFEAFPAFAAAVIIATLAHAPQARIDLLAEGWVVLRVLYLFCYLANLATLRSTVWFAAQACMVALFCAGGAAVAP